MGLGWPVSMHEKGNAIKSPVCVLQRVIRPVCRELFVWTRADLSRECSRFIFSNKKYALKSVCVHTNEYMIEKKYDEFKGITGKKNNAMLQNCACLSISWSPCVIMGFYIYMYFYFKSIHTLNVLYSIKPACTCILPAVSLDWNARWISVTMATASKITKGNSSVSATRVTQGRSVESKATTKK